MGDLNGTLVQNLETSESKRDDDGGEGSGLGRDYVGGGGGRGGGMGGENGQERLSGMLWGLAGDAINLKVQRKAHKGAGEARRARKEGEAAEAGGAAPPVFTPGWLTVYDATSGHSYYENPRGGHTTWDQREIERDGGYAIDPTTDIAWGGGVAPPVVPPVVLTIVSTATVADGGKEDEQLLDLMFDSVLSPLSARRGGKGNEGEEENEEENDDEEDILKRDGGPGENTEKEGRASATATPVASQIEASRTVSAVSQQHAMQALVALKAREDAPSALLLRGVTDVDTRVVGSPSPFAAGAPAMRANAGPATDAERRHELGGAGLRDSNAWAGVVARFDVPRPFSSYRFRARVYSGSSWGPWGGILSPATLPAAAPARPAPPRVVEQGLFEFVVAWGYEEYLYNIQCSEIFTLRNEKLHTET
jgi:hypothetical protein